MYLDVISFWYGMVESETVPFFVWSVVSGILITASAVAYRAYRRRHETPAP